MGRWITHNNDVLLLRSVMLTHTLYFSYYSLGLVSQFLSIYPFHLFFVPWTAYIVCKSLQATNIPSKKTEHPTSTRHVQYSSRYP